MGELRSPQALRWVEDVEEAVCTSNVDRLKELMSHRPTRACVLERTSTLEIACEFGTIETLQWLLSNSTLQPNHNNHMTLYWATLGNRKDMVWFLLQDPSLKVHAKMIGNAEGVLMWCVRKKHRDLLQFALNDPECVASYQQTGRLREVMVRCDHPDTFPMMLDLFRHIPQQEWKNLCSSLSMAQLDCLFANTPARDVVLACVTPWIKKDPSLLRPQVKEDCPALRAYFEKIELLKHVDPQSLLNEEKPRKI